MSKTLAGVIVAVVALATLGGIYALNKLDKTENSNQPTQPVADNTNMAEMATDQQPVQSTDQVLSGTVEMDIADFKFTKSSIKIKKGTIVKWTQQDTTKHDVTPDSVSEDFKQSELLAKGESYSVTFNTVGTFSYHCTPHPFMKGTIEVVE